MTTRPYRFAITVVVLTTAGLLGCGGSDEASTPSAEGPATTAPVAPTPTVSTATTSPTTPATPDLPGIPAAEATLIAGYPSWTELTTPPIQELRSLGSGAHGGTKRIWASPNSGLDGNEQTFPYPVGTVVIKEARTANEISLIAIMEKVRANDTATGGWRYAEYTRASGDADFAKVRFPESGCAGCHMSANTTQSTDWVFFTE